MPCRRAAGWDPIRERWIPCNSRMRQNQPPGVWRMKAPGRCLYRPALTVPEGYADEVIADLAGPIGLVKDRK